MLFNKLDTVGTDLSRPLGLLNCRQGRDKSVPTVDVSALFFQIA